MSGENDSMSFLEATMNSALAASINEVDNSLRYCDFKEPGKTYLVIKIHYEKNSSYVHIMDSNGHAHEIYVGKNVKEFHDIKFNPNEWERDADNVYKKNDSGYYIVKSGVKAAVKYPDYRTVLYTWKLMHQEGKYSEDNTCIMIKTASDFCYYRKQTGQVVKNLEATAVIFDKSNAAFEKIMEIKKSLVKKYLPNENVFFKEINAAQTAKVLNRVHKMADVFGSEINNTESKKSDAAENNVEESKKSDADADDSSEDTTF